MANLQRIKEILKEKGLTIRYLANELGISEQGLQKLIRENSTKIETLESISKILKVSIVVFFDESLTDKDHSINQSIVGNNNITSGHGNIEISYDKQKEDFSIQLAEKNNQIKELLAEQKRLNSTINKLQKQVDILINKLK